MIKNYIENAQMGRLCENRACCGACSEMTDDEALEKIAEVMADRKGVKPSIAEVREGIGEGTLQYFKNVWRYSTEAGMGDEQKMRILKGIVSNI